MFSARCHRSQALFLWPSEKFMSHAAEGYISPRRRGPNTMGQSEVEENTQFVQPTVPLGTGARYRKKGRTIDSDWLVTIILLQH